MSCAPDNDQESFKSAGPQSLGTVPHAQENWGRKLLTTKRLLLVELKQLTNQLGWATRKEIDDLMTGFKEAESSFQDFKSKINKNITECDLKPQLLNEVVDQFETCREAFQAAMHRLFRGSDENDELPEVEPEDSVSQVSKRVSKISTASSKMLARQIEIDRKRVELKAIRERDLAMAEADVAAAAAAAAAAAKAKADADAKFLVEEAKLEAEEKYIALSERGSSVTSSRRGKRSLVSRLLSFWKSCGATRNEMHKNLLTATLFHQELIGLHAGRTSKKLNRRLCYRLKRVFLCLELRFDMQNLILTLLMILRFLKHTLKDKVAMNY